MIRLLVVLTVAEILLVVGALAVYLVLIARSLHTTVRALAKLSFGVRAIETQCEPIGVSVPRINERLADVARAFDRLAGTAEAPRRG